MTKEAAIAAIEDIGWQESRPGLERTIELLEKFGSPQNELKFIHVAGSNGKGSCCAMFDAILRAAGYRCGLYTSPYIQDFCERIRIDGQNIPGEDLGAITEKIMAAADEMVDHPTQFELITAVAMIYFKEKKTDIVVLETGMGGALDSTNVIPAPELACLTNIGLEHTEFLGDTIEAIAETKGGIIKPGCTCVCYPSEPKAVDVIRKICEEKKAWFRLAECHENANKMSPLCKGMRLAGSQDGGIVNALHQTFTWKNRTYTLNLLGDYQKHNAALVLTGIEALRERGWTIPEEAIKQGLATVTWSARMEVLWKKPLFILDGGHNPQCAKALRESLEKIELGGIVFLTGVLADKDYPAMMAEMLPLAKAFVCLTPDSPRALSAKKLAIFLQTQGAEAVTCRNPEEGIWTALQMAGEDAAIVCFGSLYMAGGVRTAFLPVLRQFIRKKCIAARNALSPEVRQNLSARAVENLVSAKAFQTAKTVMIYRAVKGEVSLESLIYHPLAQGKQFCYPLCQPENRLIALIPQGETSWQQGYCGIPEPVLEKSNCVKPEEIDLIVCPCCGFDINGKRMGMGGGFYDRYLVSCSRAQRCAIAFEVQKIDDIPASDWDVPMDFIITEEKLYGNYGHVLY